MPTCHENTEQEEVLPDADNSLCKDKVAPEEICETVESALNTDIIKIIRNGICLEISIDNFLKSLDCTKECLDLPTPTNTTTACSDE